MISESATLLYAARKEAIIKSNAHFWREYSSAETLKNFSLDLEKYAREIIVVMEKALEQEQRTPDQQEYIKNRIAAVKAAHGYK